MTIFNTIRTILFYFFYLRSSQICSHSFLYLWPDKVKVKLETNKVYSPLGRRHTHIHTLIDSSVCKTVNNRVRQSWQLGDQFGLLVVWVVMQAPASFELCRIKFKKGTHTHTLTRYSTIIFINARKERRRMAESRGTLYSLRIIVYAICACPVSERAPPCQINQSELCFFAIIMYLCDWGLLSHRVQWTACWRSFCFLSLGRSRPNQNQIRRSG